MGASHHESVERLKKRHESDSVKKLRKCALPSTLFGGDDEEDAEIEEVPVEAPIA